MGGSCARRAHDFLKPSPPTTNFITTIITAVAAAAAPAAAAAATAAIAAALVVPAASAAAAAAGSAAAVRLALPASTCDLAPAGAAAPAAAAAASVDADAPVSALERLGGLEGAGGLRRLLHTLHLLQLPVYAGLCDLPCPRMQARCQQAAAAVAGDGGSLAPAAHALAHDPDLKCSLRACTQGM